LLKFVGSIKLAVNGGACMKQGCHVGATQQSERPKANLIIEAFNLKFIFF